MRKHYKDLITNGSTPQGGRRYIVQKREIEVGEVGLYPGLWFEVDIKRVSYLGDLKIEEGIQFEL